MEWKAQHFTSYRTASASATSRQAYRLRACNGDASQCGAYSRGLSGYLKNATPWGGLRFAMNEEGRLKKESCCKRPDLFLWILPLHLQGFPGHATLVAADLAYQLVDPSAPFTIAAASTAGSCLPFWAS
eukprot:scaffold36009_cov15-Tisochrysis_lutea.AAC.1